MVPLPQSTVLVIGHQETVKLSGGTGSISSPSKLTDPKRGVSIKKTSMDKKKFGKI
jgi:hypothetical protein